MAKMNPKETSKTSPKNENVNLDGILERLESLESENKALKEKVDPENAIKKGRQKYEWPRKYSYKLWWGKPVLDYKSVRKDPTRDYVYKNQFWEYIDNQLMELTLLCEDGKTEKCEVIVTQFNDGFTRSEKLEAKVESDWMNTTWYVFDTKDFWTFKVDPRIIN